MLPRIREIAHHAGWQFAAEPAMEPPDPPAPDCTPVGVWAGRTDPAPAIPGEGNVKSMFHNPDEVILKKNHMLWLK
jgi:hypothetical protein